MDILEKLQDGNLKGYLTTNDRIIFEGGVYHITQRAPGREVLFVEDGDYLYFIKLLKKVVIKFNLELFSFALLSNHLHLLLRINKKNLSLAMKNLFERFAYYFNKKYKRKGHVFCGRYRASLCNDEKYFLAASLYIHLNPYKAGLCENPGDYRWTSLKLYTNPIDESRKSFVSYAYILLILNSDLNIARKKYFDLLKYSMEISVKRWVESKSAKLIIRKAVKAVSKIIDKDEQKRLSVMDKVINDFKTKKKVVTTEDKKARKYLIQQLLANGFSPAEVIDDLSISKSTYYRIYREIKDKRAN